MGYFIEDFFYFLDDIQRFVVGGINLKCFQEVCDCFEDTCGLFKIDIPCFYRICETV